MRQQHLSIRSGTVVCGMPAARRAGAEQLEVAWADDLEPRHGRRRIGECPIHNIVVATPTPSPGEMLVTMATAGRRT